MFTLTKEGPAPLLSAIASQETDNGEQALSKRVE
jgi:hypothetical protein